MKKIIFGLLVINMILCTGCNSSNTKNETAAAEAKKPGKDSAGPNTAADDTAVKTIAVTYSDIDAKAGASIRDIVAGYLQIKNALANDNGDGAAEAGKSMVSVMRKMDKSGLSPQQKKIYDDIEDGMREDAEHIGKNGDNIKHQREHFTTISEGMYNLVKAFGGGKALYHDFCPMYNDDKGALWLSETKEVKNPYLGSKMPNCGSVEELIK